MNFNLSSDEEDNDTESEEEDEKSNVFQKFRDDELLKLKECADKETVEKFEFKEESFDRMEEDTDDDKG